MENNIGPTSLISYISFTLIFFIIKSRLGFPGTTWIWFFLVISGIIQFINNLILTNDPQVCGGYNVTTAAVATVVPWIFIFGIVCTCLVTIPGWLRVFSNTFGSSMATMAGLNDTVNKIFEKPKPQETEGAMDGIAETVNLLYANRKKFINEVELDYTKEGDVVSWPSLEAVLRYMKINIDNESKTELYNKLLIKEDVGYFIWFILIGSISILVSTNSVLLSSCSAIEFSL
jgi:hypothetical protein